MFFRGFKIPINVNPPVFLIHGTHDNDFDTKTPVPMKQASGGLKENNYVNYMNTILSTDINKMKVHYIYHKLWRLIDIHSIFTQMCLYSFYFSFTTSHVRLISIVVYMPYLISRRCLLNQFLNVTVILVNYSLLLPYSWFIMSVQTWFNIGSGNSVYSGPYLKLY